MIKATRTGRAVKLLLSTLVLLKVCIIVTCIDRSITEVLVQTNENKVKSIAVLRQGINHHITNPCRFQAMPPSATPLTGYTRRNLAQSGFWIGMRFFLLLARLHACSMAGSTRQSARYFSPPWLYSSFQSCHHVLNTGERDI